MTSSTDHTSVGPVEAFWRYRSRTIPFCIVFACLGVLLSFTGADTATATTTIYLTDPRGVPVFRDGSTSAADLAVYTQQRADFAGSTTVLGQALKALGDGWSLSKLEDDVTTAPKAGSIIVTCTDQQKGRAELICSKVADAYEELSRTETQRRTDIAINELQTARQKVVDALTAAAAGTDPGNLITSSGSIEQIDVEIARTATKASLFDAGVEFIDVSKTESSSKLLPIIQYGVAFFAFGVLISGALAWLAAVRRPIVSDPDKAAARLGAPLVGQIDFRTSDTGYELVATNLASMGTRGVIVLTGGTDSAAHASIVVGLAEAWAREGRSVLLIDGNLRRPRLSARFGAGLSTAGFTDVLGGLSPDNEAIRTVRPKDGPAIGFLSCGRAVDHASSLLRSGTARASLDRLKERYEIVIVDAAPLMDRAEGSSLASVADGVLLVVPSGTAWSDLGELRRRLDVLKAPLLGVIYDVDES